MMTANSRRIVAFCAVLTLVGSASAAAAQECVGLPAGRGILSVGFEGTDGAIGEGAAFAYQARGGAVLLQRRSLDDSSLTDERRSTEAQVSLTLPRVRLPLCLVAGVQSTSYDNAFHESTSWGTEPNYRIERHRIGGPYERVRVPVGISLGREFRVRERVSFVPFIHPAIVFDRERYEPENGAKQVRSAWGLGGSGGVTAAVDWLILRSSVSHAGTHEYGLSQQHNWPVVSVHAGVRF